MSSPARAIRLAVIVEAVSCACMIFQTQPYGFWDRLCESVGCTPFIHARPAALDSDLAGGHFRAPPSGLRPEVDHKHVVQHRANDLAEGFVLRMLNVGVAVLFT